MTLSAVQTQYGVLITSSDGEQTFFPLERATLYNGINTFSDYRPSYGIVANTTDGLQVLGFPRRHIESGVYGISMPTNTDNVFVRREYCKKIVASDGAAADHFGYSVAISGNYIVVGAYLDDDKGTNSGSAYIFDTSGNQLAKLVASDGAAGDYFGGAVAISGNYIVVGAYRDGDKGSGSGSAYIFDTSGNQLAKLVASDGAAGDFFGGAVAISGNYIVVGAYGDSDKGTNSGSAYIFNTAGNQLAKLTASDGAMFDYFGYSVAISGNYIVVGAYGDGDKGSVSGSAYIFNTAGNQLAKLTASDGAAGDYFGGAVAISGNYIVVGAYLDDDKGIDSGSAYIFNTAGNQLAKLVASDGAAGDYFGGAVAISGNYIVVGAYRDGDKGSRSGSAYIFDTSGNQLAKLVASDGAAGDYFGGAVAISGNYIVVGAYGDSDKGTNSGSAYVTAIDPREEPIFIEPPGS
jgi:hypothetical protein